MAEETFALASIILLAVLFCGLGFFVAFVEPIDRWMGKVLKKRRAKPA